MISSCLKWNILIVLTIYNLIVVVIKTEVNTKNIEYINATAL